MIIQSHPPRYQGRILIRNEAKPLYVFSLFCKRILFNIFWKFRLIDRENYFNVYYYTHTMQKYRLKQSVKRL